MPAYRQWLETALKGSTILQKYLNVHKYTFGAMDEGPGLRNAVFVQGCANFCPGCRNIQARRVLFNKLLPAQKVGREMTSAWTAKVATFTADQERGWQNILYLNALRHILWDILNTPEYLASAGSHHPLQEYTHLAKVFFARLSFITRGYRPDTAPADWLELPIQGITISGGEPFLQAAQVKRLIGAVKEMRPDWTICLYSGMYGWQEMLEDELLRSVVEMSDLVKVGSFQWSKENVAQFYFGSGNQCLIDVSGSLESNTIRSPELSSATEQALQMSTWHRRHHLIPRINQNSLRRLRLLDQGAFGFDVCEEFEVLFGPIDAGLNQGIFDYVPWEQKQSRPQLFFHRKHTLNIAQVRHSPLDTTEHRSVHVFLQGSKRPPAVDIDPQACDFATGTCIDVSTLVQQVLDMPSWEMKTSRDVEDKEYLRLNLALQKRLLLVQSWYFLTQSPYSDMSIQTYQRLLARYQKQPEMLFQLQSADATPGSQSLFVRTGDPLLQSKPLTRFCEQAREAGYEIWLEIPCPVSALSEILRSADFKQAIDYCVCGLPFKRDYPCILPFQSSIGQTVLDARTMQPWRPRFVWSKQIQEYTRAFARPEAIAKYRLSPEIVAYFLHHHPEPQSVEAFEHRVGDLACRWTAKDRSPSSTVQVGPSLPQRKP